MLCEKCKCLIPSERLEILPDTKTCVNCSEVQKVTGFMEYGHKTAGYLVMMPDDPEQRRLAERAFKRER
jgi:hypothetical protein